MASGAQFSVKRRRLSVTGVRLLLPCFAGFSSRWLQTYPRLPGMMSALESQYQRRWKIHFAKKTKHTRQNVNYLRRYLKRPPVAASKLRHYNGGTVVHHYYYHRTVRHKTQHLSQEEMLWRYISHIPSRHFKMVRYYGFLANRKRGSLLPVVYAALYMKVKEKPLKLGFSSLMKQFSLTDPYQCGLCGGRMVFNSGEAGIRAERLLEMRRKEFKKQRWLWQAA